MTTTRIKLSQAVIDQEYRNDRAFTEVAGDLGAVIDAFAMVSGAIGENFPYYNTYNLSGSTLRLNFDENATRTYTGFQIANPASAQSAAFATGTEFYAPGVVTLGVFGQLNYEYAMVPTPTGPSLSLSPSALGYSIDGIRILTHLPRNSPEYPTDFGNIDLVMNGAMKFSANGDLRGTLTRVKAAAENYIASSTIDGMFDVVSNLDAVASGRSQSSVQGTLNAFDTSFRDGSYFRVSNASVAVSTSNPLDENRMVASSGNDDIGIELPGRLYQEIVVEAGAGSDLVSLKGGGGLLHVDGGAGNDVVVLQDGGHQVNGGAGFDVVKFGGARAGVTVSATGQQGGFSVKDATGAVSQLVGVERLLLSDAAVALDIDGVAGQAYRLYQAALNRAPDQGGLGFWINAMDKGTSLTSVAASVMDSKEFRDAYGVNPSNQELVTRFYENILHRAPEAAGLSYWVEQLDKGVARAAVLAGISESGENKVGLIGVMGNGFTYTPIEG
ncbi:hypothetical protein B0920_15845 [Massilia sp. KIM]|uniref:DUF4214 domain-containing protein n=1 Tax=Massilia sp. KIM TaxID=1955422 RepID=UPI00098E90F1|nr:DUF4214 domain-containing protein [Massilia sp. KIM]OON60458.1 hypothetical protein B0920_15845 [Massilia sp. KIM]